MASVIADTSSPSRYITYRALFHYIYTCTISYTPLASSYAVALGTAEADNEPLDYLSRREYLVACVDGKSTIQPQGDCPCSPHALYCLLDELDICAELKERTHGHIVSCYTVENVRGSNKASGCLR